MNFQGFLSRKERQGSAEDRGKLIRFPQPAPAPAGGRWNLTALAPGIVTGAAEVDPAFVIALTVIGAAFKFALLWVVVLCIPVLISVLSVSGRIGMETRQGLVELLRINYGRLAALSCALVVIVINLAMIVADLLAVTDGISILLGQKRRLFLAVVAFATWYILILRDYRKTIQYLVWVSFPLLVYVAAAVLAHPDPGAILRNMFIPRFVGGVPYGLAVIALFGALLTPYLLVWQTASGRGSNNHEEHLHGTESYVGGLVTIVLACSIMTAAAVGLERLSSAGMSMGQAASALRPAVGDLAGFTFATGIIGAGMVTLPVLVASMCSSLAEAMGQKYGLSEHPWEAKHFYLMISVVILVAASLDFFIGDVVKALYWSQVLAGMLIVPVLVFILLIANDRRIMRTRNSKWQNLWIGVTIVALLATMLLLAYSKNG